MKMYQVTVVNRTFNSTWRMVRSSEDVNRLITSLSEQAGNDYHITVETIAGAAAPAIIKESDPLRVGI